MRTVCILAIFLSFAFGEYLPSFLTDNDNRSSTLVKNNKLDCYEISFLRQMINQETVIRLALVKNVHALVNDVTSLKQSLVRSETKISELQQMVVSLQQENRELKNSSRESETRIMDLEEKLQTVNENASFLNKKMNVIQRETDDKMHEMFNETNSVLDDIEIEVRYLSVTVLNFKEHTKIENESRDKKYEDLERYFNSLYEDLRDEILQTKSDSTYHKTLIQKLEESQTEMRKNFSEKLNGTVAKFETQLKTLEYEQLKLSSAVASLKMVQMNMSKANGDKRSNHAFSAGITSSNGGWTGDTLVFPVIIYSEGTGYNPSTGIFTAPTAGTYVFYISVQSFIQKYIYLEIVVNGFRKVRAMNYYGSGSSVNINLTGTNLVILHLQTGDRVWVKRTHGTGYYSDIYPATTFSGFKLY